MTWTLCILHLHFELIRVWVQGFISINSFPRPLPSHTTSTFHITNTILTITSGGGGGLWGRQRGGPFFHGQILPYQTQVTYTPCVVFFFFPYFGTLESNKQQSKEGNNQSMGGGGEICWMYPFAINQIKQSFVNKVVKFCQQRVKKQLILRVVLCCVCTLWKHPFRIIDIVASSFQENTSVWDAIWKGTLFKT